MYGERSFVATVTQFNPGCEFIGSSSDMRLTRKATYFGCLILIVGGNQAERLGALDNFRTVFG